MENKVWKIFLGILIFLIIFFASGIVYYIHRNSTICHNAGFDDYCDKITDVGYTCCYDRNVVDGFVVWNYTAVKNEI